MMAAAATSSRSPQEIPRPSEVASTPEMEDVARQLAMQVSEQLPGILHQLVQGGFDPGDHPLQLECSLTAGDTTTRTTNSLVQVASINIGRDLTPIPSAGVTQSTGNTRSGRHTHPLSQHGKSHPTSSDSNHGSRTVPDVPDSDSRPTKRRKGTGRPRTADSGSSIDSNSKALVQRDEDGAMAMQKKRTSENPALQPSTLDKFITGVWDSLFSGVRMDPTEVIEQWQAIESSGQPKLLMDNDKDVVAKRDTGIFGRMNVLTRKISQTSKTCRSLEIIVQAHWVQCFDDRVLELSRASTPEKAKKAAITEACVDFNWTEKELRNKMAIWRGYHDIKSTAGWAALVFAGAGLYRFCKYRVSFTEDTFQILRHLRHRFEVAADTLHPRWRILLSIVGGSNRPKYTGHPHDWVVNGPNDEAIPLPQTYHQWDRNFSYTHLHKSAVDEDAWGDYDPRTVIPDSDPAAHTCQNCHEHQSDDPTRNSCNCYPNLYGSPKAGIAPVQVYRTPDGKNNGLIACCAFEKGWAVGEFVGCVTTGLHGLDVMIDQTSRASYQIWQGKKGNHTRFVNHSCEPNSHYERFVWLGKQRTVLVSKGIEAGEEVTVDYGHTYWEGLDKECKCSKAGCRYRDRQRSGQQLLTPPDDHNDEIDG